MHGGSERPEVKGDELEGQLSTSDRAPPNHASQMTPVLEGPPGNLNKAERHLVVVVKFGAAGALHRLRRIAAAAAAAFRGRSFAFPQ